MNFSDLIKKVGELPCFGTSFLAAGESLSQIRLQLARWVRDGKVVRLHKGLYVLAEPYRKVKPEPFAIANALKSPSYVSLQSALSRHGVIPEFVPAVTSVTTGRPQTIDTPLGWFEYRHVSKGLFWGYERIELAANQYAYLARPEKAILDLVHLTGGGDDRAFLEELRLQNFDKLNSDILREYAERAASGKLRRAAVILEEILRTGEGIEL